MLSELSSNESDHNSRKPSSNEPTRKSSYNKAVSNSRKSSNNDQAQNQQPAGAVGPKSSNNDSKRVSAVQKQVIADVYHFVKNDSHVMETLKELSSSPNQRRSSTKPRMSLAKRKLALGQADNEVDENVIITRKDDTPPDSFSSTKKPDDSIPNEEVFIVC